MSNSDWVYAKAESFNLEDVIRIQSSAVSPKAHPEYRFTDSTFSVSCTISGQAAVNLWWMIFYGPKYMPVMTDRVRQRIYELFG